MPDLNFPSQGALNLCHVIPKGALKIKKEGF
jgi:hypothetical protein